MPMPLTAPSGDEAGTSQPDAFVGRVLEQRYRIDERLGEGGLGTVYRAQHLKLARAVAVKVLRDDLRGIPQLRARFEREVKALSSLSHPNVITITDYGIEGGTPFLVMELAEGIELAKMVGEPMPTRRALSIVRQILASLAYAHERDVVHRDLKPANVIVRTLPDGRDHVTVLDFGLAKFVGDDSGADLTRSGLVVGTPAYMPPEQMASGARRADARSDLYAAGLILFELITGRRPFPFDEAAELLRAHLVMEPPTLSEALGGASVSPALEALVARALTKTPDDRYQSARAMIDAIDAIDAFEGPLRDMLVLPSAAESAPPEVPRRDITRPARPTPLSAARASHAPTRTAAERARAVGVRAGVAAVVFLMTIAGIAWATRRSLEGTPVATPEPPAAPAPVAPTVSSPEPAPATHADEPPMDPATETAAEIAELGALVEGALVEGALVEGAVVEGAVVEGDPEGEVGVDAPEHEEPFVAPPAAAGPRPPARNPLRGRMPGVLGRVAGRLDRGRDVSRTDLRNLTRYRNDHPGDVRARLLLGHAYMSRGWYSAAVEQYQRALALDAGARGNPDVMNNLLRAARTETLAAMASDIIVRVYGDEAREHVQRAIARTRDGAERARLEALASRLGRS